MGRVFSSSALQVGKKVVYQSLDSESKSREIKKSLELLIEARLILPCYHCEASGLPLLARLDYGTFKNYLLDVGLLNSFHQISYNTLLDEFSNGFVTKGAVSEQYVAQHLAAYNGCSISPQLNYWLRDRGNKKGEIDFIIEINEQIIPIEVKSSASGKLKSLFHFAAVKKIFKAIKISVQSLSEDIVRHKIGDQVVEVKLLNFPLVLVPWFRKYLEGPGSSL